MNKPWSKRHARRIAATQKHKKKIEWQYKYLSNGYPPPVYPHTSSNGNTYLKRIYKSRHKHSREDWYLQCCNRKVRHYTGEIKSGGFYKKIADYWWLIY